MPISKLLLRSALVRDSFRLDLPEAREWGAVLSLGSERLHISAPYEAHTCVRSVRFHGR